MGLPSTPRISQEVDNDRYIKTKQPKNIVFCVGAGISTNSGIPDFRTPGTGLYSNLAALKLPYPEAVFSLQYFRQNPQPFYTLAETLYPGTYKPTLTHTFIRLMQEKGCLLKCFTQNIDTLERIAGVKPELIVEAHGSFATSRCIDCKKPVIFQFNRQSN
jgi:NAD+-dependent protein deacetylase SIR2